MSQDNEIKKVVDLFYQLCAEELAAANAKKELQKQAAEKEMAKAVTEPVDPDLEAAWLELVPQNSSKPFSSNRQRSEGMLKEKPVGRTRGVKSDGMELDRSEIYEVRRRLGIGIAGRQEDIRPPEDNGVEDSEFEEIDLSTPAEQQSQQYDQNIQEAVLAKHFPHYYAIYKKSGKMFNSIPQLFDQAELKSANVGAAEFIVRNFALKNGKIRVHRGGKVSEVWAQGLLALLRDEIAAEAESQSEFLEQVSHALLRPYFDDLNDLDRVIAEDIKTEVARKKELQSGISEEDYATKPLAIKIEKKIRQEVEKTFADIRSKEAARINANIKDVKLTINRALSRYNKSSFPVRKEVDLGKVNLEESDSEAKVIHKTEGVKIPFLSRIVALANEPGTFWDDFDAKIKELKLKKSRNNRSQEIHEIGSDSGSEALITDSEDNKLLEKALEKTDQAYYDLFVKTGKNWELFQSLRNKEFNERYFESFWDSTNRSLSLKHAIVEAEWKRVTRARKSFKKRLAELIRQSPRKDERGIYFSPQEIESRAKMNILLAMKKEKPKYGDKCYVVVDYSPDLLHKVKNKAAKQINTALRTVFSLSTGATEGIVAGTSISHALIALIPGLNAILLTAIGITVGAMGALVNVGTLSQEGKDPLKDILRWRLFGEAGNMLRKGDLGWGIFFMASTIGYSAACGIFTVSALLTIGCPPIFAVVAGILCFVALYALYQNMVTKLVKNGGLEKLKQLFNFKEEWRQLQIAHPEMSKAEKVLYFIFVKVILIKLLGLVAKLLAIVAFGKAFFGDADTFALNNGVDSKGSAGVAWFGVLLASPVTLLFVQKKMEAVWEKLKDIFTGTEGIFALAADGRRHVNKERLGQFVATALNGFAVGILKLVFLTAFFPLVLIAGMFGSIWSLQTKMRYRFDRLYREQVDHDRLVNHEIHAKFDAGIKSVFKNVAGNLGGVSAVGNATGQGALTAYPAMSTVPSAAKTASPIAGSANMSSFGFVFNLITAVTSFCLAGLSSFILNYDGLQGTLKDFTGDGQDRKRLVGRKERQLQLRQKMGRSWSELGRLVKMVTLSLFYVIARHGCVTRQSDGKVSKESFVKALEPKSAKRSRSESSDRDHGSGAIPKL